MMPVCKYCEISTGLSASRIGFPLAISIHDASLIVLGTLEHLVVYAIDVGMSTNPKKEMHIYKMFYPRMHEENNVSMS